MNQITNQTTTCDECGNITESFHITEFWNPIQNSFTQMCRVCAAFEDRD